MNGELQVPTTRRRLVVFFLLAFGLSWVIMIPEALASSGVAERVFPLEFVALAVFGPTLAAVISAALEGGREAVGSLLRRIVVFRVNWIWYFVVVIGPPLLFLVSRTLEAALGGEPPSILESPLQSELGFGGVPVGFFLLGLGLNNLVVTLGEELGWRGYALPRLQSRQSALGAGVILGSLWGLWHLPLAFAPSTQSAVSQLPFWAFLIDITAMSVLYVWIFNHTRGSVALATILHASTNTWVVPLMPPGAISVRQFYLTVAIRVAIALAVVAYFGPARLRRRDS